MITIAYLKHSEKARNNEANVSIKAILIVSKTPRSMIMNTSSRGLHHGQI